MASPAAILSILVRADTRGAQAGLIRLNQRLTATGKGAQRVTGQLATFGKVGVIGGAAGLGFAVKKAADFEHQLDSLGAVTEANTRQMRAFSKQAMKAGADTKFSALEAAAAQTELAKGGLSVRQILRGGLNSALALAAAGEMDLAEAAATTANAMKLFGIQGGRSQKVADALAKAANSTTADVSDFAMALSQGGSVAKQAGLSFTETVVALEALAQAGIKNSDAGTSLKTSLIQLLAPSEKQANLAKKLNLEWTDAQGNMKSVADISAMLRDKTDDMTRSQRLATFATLAGTDGVRTLTSLYEAGPAKIEKWKRGLEESGTAAEVAERKEDNLRGALERLRGTVETIAISIGSRFLPQLSRFADEVNEILNADRLSGGERFSRILDLVIQRITDALPDLIKAGGQVAGALATGFAKAWSDASPLQKALGGAALLRVVGGKGAITAVGAQLGHALGVGVSSGAAATVAGTAGGHAGASLNDTLSTTHYTHGLIESMKGSRWISLAGRFAGIGLGVAVVDSFVTEAGRQARARSSDVAEALKAAGEGTRFLDLLPGGGEASELGTPIQKAVALWDKLPWGRQENIDRVAEIKEQFRLMAENLNNIDAGRVEVLRNNIKSLEEVTPGVQRKLLGMVDTFQDARAGLEINLRAMRLNGGRSFVELGRLAEQNMKSIAASMGLNSKAGKEAVDRSFTTAANVIARQMARGKVSVKEGTEAMERQARIHAGGVKEHVKTNFVLAREAIERTMTRSGKLTERGMQAMYDLTVGYLKLYGLSPKQAIGNLKNIPRLQNLTTPGTPFSGRRQHGGMVVPGAGSGDKVPLAVNGQLAAMVEPGEGVYVVNRNAQKYLDQVNSKVPRMQGGGIIQLGRELQRQGYLVGENPAFGGVAPVHAPNSYHYRGMALDVNWPNVAEEPAKLDQLYARLRRMPGVVELLWRVADHFDHLHVALSGAGAPLGLLGGAPDIPRTLVGGADSPLRDIVQRQLDLVTAASQAALNGAAGGAEGSERGIATGGDFNKAQLAALWVRAGGNPGLANLMAAIALAESGGNSQIVNSIGATGLWQIHPGGPQYLDPLTNAKTAVYKLATQGLSAWEAYTNGSYTQFLQRGGPLAMLQPGGLAMASARKARKADPMSQLPTVIRNQEERRMVEAMTPPQLLRHTLGVLRGPGRKARSKALRRFLRRVKGLGLSEKMNKQIEKLTTDAEVYGEFASNAGRLTVDGPDGVPIPGMFRDKSETEWTQLQLDTLFQLRNRLIEAEKAVAEKQRMTKRLIERSKQRLDQLAEQIRAAAKRKRELDKKLTDLQKHPKRNKAAIEATKKSIEGIEESQRRRNRERHLLKDRILNQLGIQRTGLRESRDDLIDRLATVQGRGVSMDYMPVLPVPMTLSGQIFDAWDRLRELNAPREPVTDPGSDERANLERELRILAQQRLAVSQAQYEVFKNLPFAGAFAGGGVVPGLPSQAYAAVVHGGETITPAGASNVQVNLGPGMEWLDKYIEVKVNGETRKAARGRAPLPGRGGGLQRG